MQSLAQAPTQETSSSLDTICYSPPPGPYIVLTLVTLLFIFLLTKQIKHRQNVPLKNKYTLLLILTLILNYITTAAYNSMGTIATTATAKTQGTIDFKYLLLDIHHLESVILKSHLLTSLFLLTTIITLLIQKPPLATTQTHP